MEYTDATVLVIDTGWYCEIASRLADEFGEVFYWSPWQGDFPYAQDIAPGSGLPGVIRVRDLFDYVDAADLVVFPADGYEDLQAALERSGKRVWGSRRGGELERDRFALKGYLQQHGLPVIESEAVIGLGKLYEVLHKHKYDGWYVKLNRGYRGDMETFHHQDWDRTRDWFYRTAAALGPMGDRTVWMLEPPVEGFEGGADTYSVDGQMPGEVIIGYEIKDSCYVSTTKPYSNLPMPLRQGFDALVDWFSATGYKNLFSTEVRIDDGGTAYLIDLAARFPWPPSATWMANCENLGEIFYYGAEGVLVEPQFTHRFAVELGLTSPWLGDERWLCLDIPERVKPWIRLHGAARFGDKHWLRPQRGRGERGYLGSVVGTSNSFVEARRICIERAKQVEGLRVEFVEDDLKKAEKEIAKGEAAGISFFN